MLRLIHIVRQLFVDEDGPTSIEYGVMAALIAAAVIFGATTMGNETKDILEDLAAIILTLAP